LPVISLSAFVEHLPNTLNLTQLLPPSKFDISVGITTCYELDCPGSILGRGKIFLLSVQNGSGAHPASYPTDTGSDFPESKTGGT
jgi:hypothetical protein